MKAKELRDEGDNLARYRDLLSWTNISVWKAKIPKGRNPQRVITREKHPAVFADWLIMRLLELYSEEGDKVLDPMCLPAGSAVMCNPGMVPIEKVSTGSKVLTHKGRFKKVTNIYEKEYSGEFTKIKAMFSENIELTSNHPLLVLELNNCDFSDRKCLPGKCSYHRNKKYLNCSNPKQEYSLKWKRAGKVSIDDLLFIPRFTQSEDVKEIKLFNGELHPNANKIPKFVDVDEDFLWFCGMYVAEGFYYPTTVYLSNNKFKKKIKRLFKDVFNLDAKVTVKKNEKYKSTKIQANSTKLSEFFHKNFRRRAENKKIPLWILKLPIEKLVWFLKGYIDGDGCIFYHGDRIEIAFRTSSKTLSYQIQLILGKLGILSSVKKYPPSNQLRGKIKQKQDSFLIKIYCQSDVKKILSHLGIEKDVNYIKTKRNSYTLPNGFLVKILEVKKERRTEKVYNLTVLEDNSYTTNLIAVHNCGTATTCYYAQRMKRHGVCVDCIPKYLEVGKRLLSQTTLDPEVNKNFTPQLVQGDARQLEFEDESFDLAVFSPPYWDMVKYQEGEAQIGNHKELEEFLSDLSLVFQECYRVLKPEKYCLCIISDIRKLKLFSLHSEAIRVAEDAGLDLWDTVIVQRDIKSQISKRHKGAVLRKHSVRVHEYVLVFRKWGKGEE